MRVVLEKEIFSSEEREALLTRSTWYEMTLMEEEHRYPNLSSTTEVAGASSLEGAATTIGDVINLGGGSFISTFLAKREC